MTSRHLLLALGLFASVASAQQSLPERGFMVSGFAMIVGNGFSVKNNTATPLSCARGSPDQLFGPVQLHWSERFVLEPGRDIAISAAASRVYFFCDSPAERNVYALKPGQRYSYLPGQDGKIRLRLVKP